MMALTFLGYMRGMENRKLIAAPDGPSDFNSLLDRIPLGFAQGSRCDEEGATRLKVARKYWPAAVAEALAQNDCDRAEDCEDANEGESIGCSAGHAAS